MICRIRPSMLIFSVLFGQLFYLYHFEICRIFWYLKVLNSHLSYIFVAFYWSGSRSQQLLLSSFVYLSCSIILLFIKNYKILQVFYRLSLLQKRFIYYCAYIVAKIKIKLLLFLFVYHLISSVFSSSFQHTFIILPYFILLFCFQIFIYYIQIYLLQFLISIMFTYTFKIFSCLIFTFSILFFVFLYQFVTLVIDTLYCFTILLIWTLLIECMIVFLLLYLLSIYLLQLLCLIFFTNNILIYFFLINNIALRLFTIFVYCGIYQLLIFFNFRIAFDSTKSRCHDVFYFQRIDHFNFQQFQIGILITQRCLKFYIQ